jgi:hypothetical protein
MYRLCQSGDHEMALGAYGLRLVGINEAAALLARAAADWPTVEVFLEVRELDAHGEHLDEDRARLRLRTGGWIELSRKPGRAHYIVPAPMSVDELVHPFLAPSAAVFTYWHRREGFHGGALALDGTAWGVIGDRLGGKSSLLASLAVTGIDVLCDDVLVVDRRGTAYPGPRTIDLREDAAIALGAGEEIGAAGTRRRWRLRLPQIDGAFPLGGWIFIAWGDDLEMRRVAAPDTLGRLFSNRSITVPPRDPAEFLQLSALPAWELVQPRSWAAVPETLELLLGRLGDS